MELMGNILAFLFLLMIIVGLIAVIFMIVLATALFIKALWESWRAEDG